MTTAFDPAAVLHRDGWSGPYGAGSTPPGTLPAALAEVVERCGEHEALVVPGGARWSYARLWEEAQAVAGGLAAAGVRAGDRVAIRRGNDVGWCLAFVAVTLLGAVSVPVNSRFTDAEATHVVDDSGARLVICDEELPRGRPVTAPAATAPDDPVAIFYTSGTTGLPKGAVLSHRSVLTAAAVTGEVLELAPGAERNLVAAPLFHVMATAVQWLPTWLAAGTTVLLPGFDAAQWLASIADEAVTVLTAVPAMYFLALARPEIDRIDLRGVRHLGYGSAPTPPAQVRRLADAFPNARLAPGYGLTESAGVATTVPHADAVRLAHAIGYASPGTRLGLLDARAEDGGDVGELMVHGTQVMSGYHGRPDATDAVLAAGWLRTGDVAHIDPDGAVSLLDRRTDMINRGGENVYCVEVERALAAHPDVAEVAVVGVPDDALGQKVGAVVVARPERAPAPGELVEVAAGRLADYKLPQYVAISHDPLPRTRGGKVDKSALRARNGWVPVSRRAGR